VLNPSFEDHSSCPDNAGQIGYAIGWEFYNNSSPEYFHSCATTSEYLVPKNLFGYQYAYAGNAYAGIIVYYEYDVNGVYTEIFGIQLTNNLSISQKYYISLKVNRADSNFFAGYSINNIGVKFFTSKPISVAINNSAHFYTNNVITDTVNWTLLFGSFVADSAYQYILIGNFFDTANTTIVNDGNGPWAYYYVDDVCVSTDSSFAYNYTGINDDKITIYPNPTEGQLFISSKEQIEHIKIYSSLGQIIKQLATLYEKELFLDLSSLTKGLYFCKIKTKNESIVKKIIINH